MSKLRMCGMCHTWNSKPCGDQCGWDANSPAWEDQPSALAQGVCEWPVCDLALPQCKHFRSGLGCHTPAEGAIEGDVDLITDIEMMQKLHRENEQLRAQVENVLESCAKLAEAFNDQGRDGHQIAKAIRAGDSMSFTSTERPRGPVSSGGSSHSPQLPPHVRQPE